MFGIEIDAQRFVKDVRRFEDSLDGQLRTAMEIVSDEIVNDAKSHAPHKTGVLEASIQKTATTGSFNAGTLAGHVGAGAPYAEYVEEGTRPHTIAPKHRNYLRWPINGGYRFARKVRHPGTKAHPFMGPAIESLVTGGGKLVRIFDSAVQLAARKAGF